MNPIITVNHINFMYVNYQKHTGFANFFKRQKKFITALKDLSITLNKGEIVGLLGLNGAGKTTLIKLLTGILTPNNGVIEVLGYNPFEKKRSFLKQIGVMFGQKSQLIWDLSPMNTLLMLREIYEIPNNDFKDRIDFFTEKLNIKEQLSQPVRKLSLGQRIKFELICSLIHNPQIVFLDEPTIGVDIPSKLNIYDFLLELNQVQNTTIILTSHDSQDIEWLAQHIIILNHGTKLFDGSKSQLKTTYAESQQFEITTNRELYNLPQAIQKIDKCTYRLATADLSQINISDEVIISIKRVGSDLNDILAKFLTSR